MMASQEMDTMEHVKVHLHNAPYNICIQENYKFCELKKREYRDGEKSEDTR